MDHGGTSTTHVRLFGFCFNTFTVLTGLMVVLRFLRPLRMLLSRQLHLQFFIYEEAESKSGFLNLPNKVQRFPFIVINFGKESRLFIGFFFWKYVG